MGKVYMMAEDNEAGITVEERFVGVAVYGTRTHSMRSTNLTDAEVSAVVEGLLRRMLELDGVENTTGFVHRVVRDWTHHGVVRGGQMTDEDLNRMHDEARAAES